MNSYLIFAVLLISLKSAVPASISTTNGPTEETSTGFSSRLYVKLKNGISEGDVPTNLARKMLLDMRKFNLIGEIVRAKFSNSGLLVEMGSALQANEVASASDPSCETCAYTISVTKENFFPVDNRVEITYRQN
ncbi:uncharacterized protein LOC132796860 [Drosophila nasuta]|uniref:uncharacterized protein LOC132796860 n=1 Tax=Drosophila nasuta TaxID=42062 RepID=UPI00295E6020|nr:uncharacterized protein LOC132796860 [Drosophila nasuta]